MAKIWFDGLPVYSWLGGAIEGTLVLETDKPLRATDVDLGLVGQEVGFVTVQEGKSRTQLSQNYPFLELTSTFHDSVNFADPSHIAPGTYRLPFRFDVPAAAEPSLATSEVPAVRGRFFAHPDGLYVEYVLEARVRVPWWIDPVDRVAVPVYSPRRVLGVIPPVPSPADPERPSFRITVDPTPVVPGTPVAASYEIQNPRGKLLENFLVRVYRHVEYTVRGRTMARDGPSYETLIPLGDRRANWSGQFQVAVPNGPEVTGPFHGGIYRTFWMMHAELAVEFGFNVKMEAAFTPA